MNMIFHYIKKELRTLRWPLFLFFVCVAANCLLTSLYYISSFTVDSEGVTQIQSIKDSFVLGLLQVILCIHLLVIMVQNDLSFSPRSFWLTRPVPLRVMLSGKALIFIGILLVYLHPTFLEFQILQVGRPLLVDFLQWSFILFAPLPVLVVWLALFTENKGRFYSFVAGILVLCSALSLSVALFRMGMNPASADLVYTRLLVASVICFVVPLASIVLLFVSRKSGKALQVGIWGYVVTIFVSHFWPTEMMSIFESNRASSNAPNVPSKVIPLTGVPLQTLKLVNNVEYLQFHRSLKIETPENGSFPVVNYFQSELIDEMGEKMFLRVAPRIQDPYYALNEVLRGNETLEKSIPGYQLGENKVAGGVITCLGQIRQKRTEAFKGKKWTLNGRLRGEYYRYQVVGEIEKGKVEKLVSKGVMVRLVGGEVRDGKPVFQLKSEGYEKALQDTTPIFLIADRLTKILHVPKVVGESQRAINYGKVKWFRRDYNLEMNLLQGVVDPSAPQGQFIRPLTIKEVFERFHVIVLEPVSVGTFSGELVIPDFTIEKLR